ncbi:Ankyrin repeat domain containing protein [Pandoravirus neocaledonia]|uniref:Ankyrin repeat domain containing protein n=1 Tax=Pandoravirus neocaledonia TaxID=2107708 RepID=A0A2U7UCD8_9VIRU|nr:Ankyrin repeat domain containing protein [Pandoravirus neocaledonia]AVK76093.1 Ankyrin repeat domain containing protein [Pandoravirus neocaledonia]
MEEGAIEPTTGMTDMPPEIIDAILDRLGPADRFVCALVSPLWRASVRTQRAPLLARRDEEGDWEGKPRLHQRRTFLTAACRLGRLDLAQWAIGEGCPWDADTWVDAAHRGHVDVLVWLQATGCPCSVDRCLVAAADGGHVALVHVFLRHQRSTESVLRPAIEQDTVKNTQRASLEDAIRRAVCRGHRDVLEVLLEDGRVSAVVAWIAAASLGDIGLFEWLQDNGYDAPRDASAHAAAHGHIGALEWLRDRGKLYVSGCHISAVLADHARIVDWVKPLHTHGWLDGAVSALAAARYGRADALSHWSDDLERLAVEAARNGHLDVVARIKKGGKRVSRMQTLAAAYGGHTHILAWAASAGIRLSGLATAIAAVRGHAETAQFCERHCGIKMRWEFDEPVWQGFMLESDRPLFRFGPRRHALDMALSYGGSAVVARLLERLPADAEVTHGAFCRAVATHNLAIVPPLARCAPPAGLHLAWHEAAMMADIAMLKRLRDACGWPDRQIVQNLFVHAGRSRYGWRGVFEWLAWAGMRCDAVVMSHFVRQRTDVAQAIVAWAADRWSL